MAVLSIWRDASSRSKRKTITIRAPKSPREFRDLRTLLAPLVILGVIDHRPDDILKECAETGMLCIAIVRGKIVGVLILVDHPNLWPLEMGMLAVDPDCREEDICTALTSILTIWAGLLRGSAWARIDCKNTVMQQMMPRRSWCQRPDLDKQLPEGARGPGETIWWMTDPLTEILAAQFLLDPQVQLNFRFDHPLLQNPEYLEYVKRLAAGVVDR